MPISGRVVAGDCFDRCRVDTQADIASSAGRLVVHPVRSAAARRRGDRQLPGRNTLLVGGVLDRRRHHLFLFAAFVWIRLAD